MGGEWTTAAALIAETWRAEHRGKALGLMQSAYAIGEAIAAMVVAIVLPHFGWRAVFLVGVLPAIVVLWIRRSVPESEIVEATSREIATRKAQFAPSRRDTSQRNSCDGDEFLRNVRLLGTVHLDSRIPFATYRARRPTDSAWRKPLRFSCCYAEVNGSAMRYLVFSQCIRPQAPIRRILLIAALLVPVYGLVHLRCGC